MMDRLSRIPCRTLSTVPAGLFAALAVWLLLSRGPEPAAAQPPGGGPPPAVAFVEARAGSLPLSREYAGRVEAVDTVEVRARIEGYLKERRFKEGSLVRRGDVLFVIDPRESDEALKRASAELARARAAHLHARQNLDRFRPLAKAGAVSKSDLDAAVAAEAQAEAQVEAAKAAEAKARIDLELTIIRAPVDGRIGRSAVNVGGVIKKSGDTLLATITTVDPVYVSFSLSETEHLAMIRSGKSLGAPGGGPAFGLALADGTDYPLPGRLDMTDPAVDQKTGTIGARAVFPNPDGLLRPGQYARIKVAMGEASNVILVPERAVREVQGVPMVLVLDAENKVAQRKVRLGERTGTLVVVQEGLAPGERVVVEGMQKARPGAVVRPEPWSAPGNGKKG